MIRLDPLPVEQPGLGTAGRKSKGIIMIPLPEAETPAQSEPDPLGVKASKALKGIKGIMVPGGSTRRPSAEEDRRDSQAHP